MVLSQGDHSAVLIAFLNLNHLRVKKKYSVYWVIIESFKKNGYFILFYTVAISTLLMSCCHYFNFLRSCLFFVDTFYLALFFEVK